ncbi:MAG: hypothetical protein ABIB43_04290 [archaeon]
MLTQKDIDKIIKFVKQEPCTVQDVSKLIKRSWVTTDSYLKKIQDNTGLISIKTFRKGSQGALKIVYYNQTDMGVGDDLKDELLGRIKVAKRKTDFEFFDIFQLVSDDKKEVFFEEYESESDPYKQDLVSFLRRAQHTLYIFSGNLSFINLVEDKTKMIDVFHELVKRKVVIKILCRVNISSMNNFAKLSTLINKYPEFIEIKHSFQPLRGFVVDDSFARFKSEELLKDYRLGELNKNTRIFYEVYDKDWISWFQKVFWSIYRFSTEYSVRMKQLKKYF